MSHAAPNPHLTESSHVPSDPNARRADLDALRVFACYLLVLFHVGMVFNPAPFYHVRNGEVNLVFLILCGFISLWHMPLFFLLAGWSAAASLRARGVLDFLRERGAKLAVPLLAACILLAPPIKYLELRSGFDLNHRGLWVSEELQQSFRQVIPVELPRAEPFDESFLAFLPTFFTNLDRFSWSHLWFLAYLLALTLVLLPVFVLLTRRVRTSAALPSRLWIYAPLAPLLAVQLGLRERFPGIYNLYNDWANMAYFATFLVAGFVLFLVPRLGDRLDQEWRRALGLAVAALLVLLAAVLELFQSTPVVLTAAAVAAWCFVVALLGFAGERVHPRGARFRYLVESAFPVYLLHQSVIVFLAYGIVELPLNLFVKFVLLLAGSLAVTLVLFHFLVRPYAPVRFLAGLKRKRTHPAATGLAATRRPAAPMLGRW